MGQAASHTTKISYVGKPWSLLSCCKTQPRKKNNKSLLNKIMGSTKHILSLPLTRKVEHLMFVLKSRQTYFPQWVLFLRYLTTVSLKTTVRLSGLVLRTFHLMREKSPSGLVKRANVLSWLLHGGVARMRPWTHSLSPGIPTLRGVLSHADD